MIKLKTFENYERTGDIPKQKPISDEEINNKIKEVISNILKAKLYFEMLQDTVTHVYDMLEKQIPPNKVAFQNTINDKDPLLAGILEDLLEIFENQEAITEVDEIVSILKNLEEYTADNMDNLLSGENDNIDDDDEEEEDDDEYIDIMKPPKMVFDDSMLSDELSPKSESPNSQLKKRDKSQQKMITCPKCNGKGENDKEIECDKCAGAGLVPVAKKFVECSTCNGTGKNSTKACTDCGGSGLKEMEEQPKKRYSLTGREMKPAIDPKLKLRKSTNVKFENGDPVNIIKGLFNGKNGKITSIDKGYKTCQIKLDDGPTIDNVKLDDIEKLPF